MNHFESFASAETGRVAGPAVTGATVGVTLDIVRHTRGRSHDDTETEKAPNSAGICEFPPICRVTSNENEYTTNAMESTTALTLRRFERVKIVFVSNVLNTERNAT